MAALYLFFTVAKALAAAMATFSAGHFPSVRYGESYHNHEANRAYGHQPDHAETAAPRAMEQSFVRLVSCLLSIITGLRAPSRTPAHVEFAI